jgi:hypothetical protein
LHSEAARREKEDKRKDEGERSKWNEKEKYSLHTVELSTIRTERERAKK